ncbi:hypothetical protein KXP94_001235 [Staphylococcus pseudintermedius]|nr:hypothetical protein [Staphylococcus pseudintermedius]EIO0114187.1 hypothetical protein [Staphylococcus pseudintermedius]
MPIQTLTRWLSIYRKDGEKGFVGSGKRTTKKQTEADLEKRLRDLEEENKNLKKDYAHLCQRPEVIYKFIYEHRYEFRVVKMCQVLGVSRSGYYDWKNRKPSARIVKRDGLKKQIYQIYIKKTTRKSQNYTNTKTSRTYCNSKNCQ